MKADYTASHLDPYIFSFEASLASKNYKPMTLRTYRCILRSFCRLMEAESIAASALTPDAAAQFAHRLPTSASGQVKPIHLVRRFAEHLIEIGVAAPLPVTAAQAQRAELLSGLDTYLVRQRGLSPRTIEATLGFAKRFLDYRYGDGMLDLPRLRSGDVIAFMENLHDGKRPFRDKTPGTHLRSFFQYLFAQGITAANLSLCIPRIRKAWGHRLPRHLAPGDVEKGLASARANP